MVADAQLGFYTLLVLLAMAICMAIIPLMIKIAPAIGMLDAPDDRKVHSSAVPRSGGIGIVVGLMLPLLIWIPLDKVVVSVLCGCAILLIFGAWDDARAISPKLKFIGQFLATAVVVFYGDLYVSQLPFASLDGMPEWIAKPFTVFAIVGMINALNLSDGLDGLAGGEALISLIAIAYLSYQFDGITAMAVCAATIGGIFGFLRFNSHPAKIFMGDAGSQTLGFLLGVTVIMLTQRVNPVMSPVAALLLLGLPVLDCLVVFYMRWRRGDSLVVAAKDHLHHRLLAIGFHHYESVTVIYTVQAVLVSLAVFIPYESDALLLSLYALLGVVLYTSVLIAERTGWRVHAKSDQREEFLSTLLMRYPLVNSIPEKILMTGLTVVLLASVLTAETIPSDIGISSLLLIVLLIIWYIDSRSLTLLRLIVFISLGTSSYLISTHPPEWLLEDINLVYLFYGLMMLAAFVRVRLSSNDQFAITPLDYLVIIIAVVVALMPETDVGSQSLTFVAIQMIILFYSAEMIIQKMRSSRNALAGTLLVTLILLSARALL